MMRETHLSRARERASTDECRNGERVVRRAKGAFGDESPTRRPRDEPPDEEDE